MLDFENQNRLAGLELNRQPSKTAIFLNSLVLLLPHTTMASASSSAGRTSLSPTRIRLEAKRLLDVAMDAKISDGSSTYLRSMLDNVSTELSGYRHDSADASVGDESGESDEGRESPQLSMSGSQGDLEASRAKKELLAKILSAQVAASRSRADLGADSGVGIGSGVGLSGASQASTVDPVFTARFRVDSGGVAGGSLGGTSALYPPPGASASAGVSTGAPGSRTGSPSRRAPGQGDLGDLTHAQDTILLLTAELERHRRISESTLEGEHIERRASEERTKRMAAMLEAETALRRQYEDKARSLLHILSVP